MEDRNTRILVCDDHELLRIGIATDLSRQPGFMVVGEAADAEQAVQAARRFRPDVAVVDLRMPRGGGFSAIRRMKEEGTTGHVVVLSSYETYSDADRAIEAGADAYVKKEDPPEELVKAIRKVVEGGTQLSSGAGARTMSRLRGDKTLSSREVEILRFVMAGKSNREIGQELRVSEGTVKSVLLSAYGKLGVDDRTAAVVAAVERGVLRIEVA